MPHLLENAYGGTVHGCHENNQSDVTTRRGRHVLIIFSNRAFVSLMAGDANARENNLHIIQLNDQIKSSRASKGIINQKAEAKAPVTL